MGSKQQAVFRDEYDTFQTTVAQVSTEGATRVTIVQGDGTDSKVLWPLTVADAVELIRALEFVLPSWSRERRGR